LYLPKTSSEEGNIGIRIAPFPGSVFDLRTGGLQLAVCFVRPTNPNSQVESPFKNNGSTKTTFLFSGAGVGLAPNLKDSAGSPTGWFFYLGKIADRPDNPGHKPHRLHNSRRHQYALGIIVKQTLAVTDERHFSLDPEMEIGPDI